MPDDIERKKLENERQHWLDYIKACEQRLLITTDAATVAAIDAQIDEAWQNILAIDKLL